ncbi:MAG: hypothetical protein U0168_03470 [Nannocystaceae bacterium]
MTRCAPLLPRAAVAAGGSSGPTAQAFAPAIPGDDELVAALQLDVDARAAN